MKFYLNPPLTPLERKVVLTAILLAFPAGYAFGRWTFG